MPRFLTAHQTTTLHFETFLEDVPRRRAEPRANRPTSASGGARRGMLLDVHDRLARKVEIGFADRILISGFAAMTPRPNSL
jgi:hypothetical protein